jgi:hypothetical protein
VILADCWKFSWAGLSEYFGLLTAWWGDCKRKCAQNKSSQSWEIKTGSLLKATVEQLQYQFFHILRVKIIRKSFSFRGMISKFYLLNR